MNIVVNNHNIYIIVAITFLCSLIMVPIVKKLAIYLGAIDMPNERKIHSKPMPRLGGLAIYSSFLLGYILFGELTTQMLSVLIGSFIILLIGIFDDIKPIKARYKFLVQIVAALVVVIYGQVYFTEISLFGTRFFFSKTISYVLSTIFVVAISNAINFVDGLDGLAGGISSIYFLTISIIAIILGRLSGLDILLSLIMLGATLGFLIHNFPPAKIFMGDSGSLFLGFMISVIALTSFKVATITTLIVPIVILAIPIFDIILAILRRILKGENIGSPDKEHFHHQLLKLKFSQRLSILIIYSINILFSAVSIFFVIGDNSLAITIYVLLMLLLLFIVMKTDILFEHKKEVENERKKK